MTTIAPSKVTSRQLRVAEALNHLIVIVCAANAEYWQRPDQELLAEMNANVSTTLEMFDGNYNLAVSLNASQDALNVVNEQGQPVYTARAPIARGRDDIGFADGVFFVIQPEPQPES